MIHNPALVRGIFGQTPIFRSVRYRGESWFGNMRVAVRKFVVSFIILHRERHLALRAFEAGFVPNLV
jgi:hypothetical protein